MSAADVFYDTNVLLYLLSAEPAEADQAERLLAQQGTVSVQVLNEFAAVALRKLKMTWPEIREVLSTVRAVCEVTPLTLETHDRAVALCERYSLSIHDGLIVAAALLAGCTTLYSEDMQDGQILDDQITIRNPFRIA